MVLSHPIQSSVLTGEFIADDGTRDVIHARFAGGRLEKDAGKSI